MTEHNGFRTSVFCAFFMDSFEAVATQTLAQASAFFERLFFKTPRSQASGRGRRARGSADALLEPPLVGRGGRAGAADRAVGVARLRRLELLPEVLVRVREEVLREDSSSLSAPVHAA